MQKLKSSDLWPLPEYEQRRDDFRHRVIEQKKLRRIYVGPLLSFIFENRDTVLFQVQEMLRAERATEPERVQEELDVYNTILPQRGELSVTLFVEITDPDRLDDEMIRLQGLDQAVCLEIGDDEVPAKFEPGRTKEAALSTVQYLKFHLTPSQRAALRSEGVTVALAIRHDRYRERVVLSPETCQELARDLEG